MTTNNTTNNNSNEFYNNSLTATCYFNEIRVVETKSKGKSYCSIKAVMLDGKKGEANYQKLDLIVSGEEVKELIWANKDKWPTFNDKTKDAWYAAIRVGSVGVKPYIAKDDTAKATLSGRLLQIKYLAIGDIEIYKAEQSVTTDEVAIEDDSLITDCSKALIVDEVITSPVIESVAEIVNDDEKVKLDPKDSKFKQKREALKSRGYTWSKEETLWIKPTVAA